VRIIFQFAGIANKKDALRDGVGAVGCAGLRMNMGGLKS